MKDRSVQYPNRYKMTQISDGIVDLVAQPGTVTEAGTPLNKANLLSDATASAIGGLSSDPTVNDALNRLKTLITTAQNTANGRTQTQIVSYVGTGTYGESNPTTITFSFTPKVVVCLYASSRPYFDYIWNELSQNISFVPPNTTGIFLFQEVPTSYTAFRFQPTGVSMEVTIRRSGNSIQIYSNKNAFYQYNDANYNKWLAIG